MPGPADSDMELDVDSLTQVESNSEKGTLLSSSSSCHSLRQSWSCFRRSVKHFRRKVIKFLFPIYTHRIIHIKGSEMIATKNPSSPTLMASISVCPRRLVDTSTLKLVEFSEDATIPPYAILSHSWITGEEVVYDEFIHLEDETKLKSGYLKIEAACRQARKDDIRYIWIDTCCIEQGNHADVKTNITSMYAYYQNAYVCYSYLADFPEPAIWFRASKWFRRGWTLQELVAPRTVIFFDKYWHRIGDKGEFLQDVSLQTIIPSSILSGRRSIHSVDMLTRMSWATLRRTTRPQDRAYCLQGLLGVSVEPDYKEHWRTSFNRLGKALFDTHPELKAKLGISDELFIDLDSKHFYALIHKKSVYKIQNSVVGMPGRMGLGL
ncbi:hypothetical protein VKT23_005162 [Stygiomarasmius scandens]|uniref:Heterokaryon incompatibility domain-containing protein n=1 Tax=Marasmiellus scandens TaxID=2682957 RepID=A0ABR1JY75_9AGAR